MKSKFLNYKVKILSF